MFVRMALVVLVVLVAATLFLGYSAYTTVQAQTARLVAAEQLIGTIKADVDRVRSGADATAASVKQIQDDVARLRSGPAPIR